MQVVRLTGNGRVLQKAVGKFGQCQVKSQSLTHEPWSFGSYKLYKLGKGGEVFQTQPATRRKGRRFQSQCYPAFPSSDLSKSTWPFSQDANGHLGSLRAAKEGDHPFGMIPTGDANQFKICNSSLKAKNVKGGQWDGWTNGINDQNSKCNDQTKQRI